MENTIADDNDDEVGDNDDDDDEGDDDDDDFISKPPTKSKSCQSQGNSSSAKTSYSGAILADEMGLGKTLTAIATVWTFVRRGQAKGIPFISSLLCHDWDRRMYDVGTFFEL